MWKATFLFFTVILSNILFAQQELAPDLEWEKTFEDKYKKRASIIQTSDGGYIMCGQTYEESSGENYPRYIRIIKLDANGTLQWDKKFGKEKQVEATAIIQSSDKGYVISGAKWNKKIVGKNHWDAWVIKLSNEGDIQWDKTFGGNQNDGTHSVIQTEDGGYALCGYTESKGEGEHDAWVIKLNKEGQLQWDKTFGGKQNDVINSIIQTEDGGYALGGFTESKGEGEYDAWVIKLNKEGQLQWDKTFGGKQNDFTISIIQTEDGGYALGVNTESKGEGEHDAWVIKLNKEGQLKWDKTFGGKQNDFTNSIIQTEDGGYALGVSTESKGEGEHGAWVIKLTNEGDIQWDKTLGGSKKDVLNSIIQTTDGEYVGSGANHSKRGEVSDFWVFKLRLNLMAKVENYVSKKIIKWQKKGKYEKLSDYKQRVNENNRKNKIEEFTQQAYNLYGSEIFNKNINKAEFEYDSQNEVFKITIPEFTPLYVKVPIDEAPEFDKAFNKLKYKNTDFALAEDKKFLVKETDIYNPSNQQTYHCDATEPVNFKSIDVTTNFSKPEITLESLPSPKSDTKEEKQEARVDKADIDKVIPKTKTKNPNAIAVIIGNKDYKHTKDVKYALNDAQIMKQYLVKTLGYKPGNVFYLENATKSNFETYFGTKVNPKGILYNQLKKNQSEVFVYYAGHGAPDLDDHKAYFVPVDCDPNYLEQGGYPRELFYSNISKLPAKNVTVVIDACFSGSEVYEDMSPVMPKVTDPMEKMDKGVVFSSSRGSQVSTWYNEKNHSMFTYFFLKAIKDKEESDANNDGKLTYGELFDYISDQNEGMPYYARKIHGVEQEPEMRGQAEEEVFVEY